MSAMTRRQFAQFAAALPLAAMSTPIPTPVYEQRLPLLRLPAPAMPAGLGVGAPWQSGDDIPAMLEQLRPAWWYDWRFEQAGAPGYMPMIWSDGIWADHAPVIESLFERRPDLFWLLWNEPERADQANMSPEATAALTGAIAEYGINYAAPGVAWGRVGMEWLEAYLAAGGPMPHCWHIHIYWCHTPVEWEEKWASWKAWMQEHNVVRPTIVSETNAWEEGAYGQSRMIAYLADLLATDDLLLAVAWYATQAYNWGAGHPQLLSEARQLTSVGRTFAAVRAAAQ